MEISEEQYQRIAQLFPKHRGNVRYSNLEVLNVIHLSTENGCKWRGLPDSNGNWNTFYQSWYRWNKRGLIQQMFEELQEEEKAQSEAEIVALDSTSVKVHPDGTGALKNMVPKPSANPTAVAIPKST